MPRIVRPVFFFSVVAAFLWLTNLVVYTALSDVFSLTNSQSSQLALAMFVLSGSFIASSVLGMRYYNWFTRWYYRIAATWIGLFVYLFFGATFIGLLAAFTGTLIYTIGVLAFVAALLVAIYGYVHAKQIYVTEVTVKLRNLPENWQNKKAIWVSDVHIGQIHGLPFANRVVAAINTLPHDIVFIGGDLFDGTGAPDIEELAQPFGKCTAPLGIYFISGNHEEYGDHSRFVKAVEAAGIRVLTNELVDVAGLQIVGVDYRSASDREHLETILKGISIDKSRPAILLKHEPVDLDVAADAGIALHISGHTHNGQMWPFGYIATLVHKGYAYGLKKFRDMNVFVSSGTGTWGPPMRVGTRCEIVVFTFI